MKNTRALVLLQLGVYFWLCLPAVRLSGRALGRALPRADPPSLSPQPRAVSPRLRPALLRRRKRADVVEGLPGFCGPGPLDSRSFSGRRGLPTRSCLSCVSPRWPRLHATHVSHLRPSERFLTPTPPLDVLSDRAHPPLPFRSLAR